MYGSVQALMLVTVLSAELSPLLTIAPHSIPSYLDLELDGDNMIYCRYSTVGGRADGQSDNLQLS